MSLGVHRQNTDFQLRYFIAGGSHTPDGAWAALYNQKIDMENKLQHSEAQKLKRESAIIRSQTIIDDPKSSKADKVEAEAEIKEQKAKIPTWEMNVKGAQNELNTINKLMEELEPFRKYSDYDPIKAAELAQHDEWREELKSRAENMLAANTLGIAWDQLQTMRSHPDFHEHILPRILEVGNKLQNASQENAQKQLESVLEQPTLFHDKESK